MKHRGPAASIHPARDAARRHGRALLTAGPAASVSPSPQTPATRQAAAEAVVHPGACGVVVGDWVLGQDPESGALVAWHTPTGQHQVLAEPPAEPAEPAQEGN